MLDITVVMTNSTNEHPNESSIHFKEDEIRNADALAGCRWV